MRTSLFARLVAVSLLSASALAGPAGTLAGQSPEEIPWELGPTVAKLGAIATLNVPEGFRFTGKEGTRAFMELTENPTDGSELGVLVGPVVEGQNIWFVIFSYDASGYVKDDDKDKLDADAILSTIRRGTEQGNKERRKRGWGTLSIDGWIEQPFYDQQTNNLTWSIKASSDEGATVNHSVRLLGRGGVMHADLVLDPEQLATVVPTFNGVVGGFEFISGQKYAEWRNGDKIASYGLTALVAGGAGALAVKTGILARFWKVLIAGVLAALAGIRKLFGSKSATAGVGAGR